MRKILPKLNDFDYLFFKGLLEAAYRLLCQKLWLQVKPGGLSLTSKERDFLSKAFPRRGAGRKPGVDARTLESVMLYDTMRPSCDTDIECYASIAKKMGMSSHDVAKKSVNRGQRFVSKMVYDPVNDDLVNNIQQRYDDAIIRSILNTAEEELPEKN